MLEPRFVTYADTPSPGSQEEHIRTMRVLAFLADHRPLHLLNHDGREVLVTTHSTAAGAATSVESCTDGLIDSFAHASDRVGALEAAARLAVNVMSRSTLTTRELLETR